MQIAAIIQARMGSTRLPGKAMMPILGKPILQWIIERIFQSSKINHIIIATTPTSQEILDFYLDYKNKNPKDKKLSLFISSENDVLKRVCQASAKHKLDIIVDITSDCPFIDPVHINKLVTKCKIAFINHKYAYCSNINPRCWPDGFDCQVYSPILLYEVENQLINSKDPKREHSGWNILRSPNRVNYIYNLFPDNENYNLPNMRLTLDYQEDFEAIKSIIEYFRENWIYLKAEEIIDYALDNPDIFIERTE